MRYARCCSLMIAVVLFAQCLLPLRAAAAGPQPFAKRGEPAVAGDSFRTGRPASLADARQYGYRLRHRYRYGWSLKLRTASLTEDSSGVRRSDGEAFETAGTVELIPVQRLADGSHLIQAKITDPHVWTVRRGERVDSASREFAAQLAKPAYFAQRADGEIAYLVFAADDSIESQNLKRGIISSLQVRLGADPAGAVVELDPTGEVASRYARVAVGDSVQVSRERGEDDFRRLTDPSIRPGAIDIAQSQVAVFDPGLGSVRSIATADRVASVRDGAGVFAGEGAGFWSLADGQGQLTLNTVTAAPVTDPLPAIPADATQAAVIDSINRHSPGYRAGTLLATLDGRRAPLPAGLTLAAALEGIARDTTGSYAPIDALAKLLQREPAAVAELRRLIESGAVDAAHYPALASALAASPAPAAQDLVVALMIGDRRLPEQTRNDALLSLLEFAAPQPATISAVRSLSQSADPLAPQALAVLGGLLDAQANHDPAAAAAGARALEQELAQAADDARREGLLTALGNAGDAGSLPAFASYLRQRNPDLRLAALEALRKLPAADIRPLLESALGDSDPVVAAKAAALLAELEPAPPAKAGLGADLNADWDWALFVGGGNLFALLRADLKASKPNGSLLLNGSASADIMLWNTYKKDVIKAEAVSKLLNSSTRRFGFYVYVMGNKVYTKNFDVPCESAKEGTLYDKKLSFFSASYGVWVYGIWVGFSIDVGGSVTIKYALTYKTCGGDATVEAHLKPGMYLWASGGVHVSIGIAEAGAKVELEFLRTWLPGTLTGYVDPDEGLKVKLHLALEFKPISVKFVLWYKVFNPFCWCWEHDDWTVAKWSFSGYTVTLINKWFVLD